MRTILVTGASGFIGGHLIKALARNPLTKNDRPVLLSSKYIEGHQTILHRNYVVTKESFLNNGINEVDVVIHAGAFTPKSGAFANDLHQCNTNIISLNELIGNLPSIPKKFIFLSTLDVYQNITNNLINEESPCDPETLYGWSKLYGEKIVEKWASQNGLTAQVLRIGHIYGSGEERYQKLIPTVIKKALSGQSAEIQSRGEELRSYLHIRDCVECIISSLELPNYVGPINIVSNRALSVKYIVQTILNYINPSIGLKILGKDIPVRDFVFNNDKMSKYLGIEKVAFEDGIKEEIEAYC